MLNNPNHDDDYIVLRASLEILEKSMENKNKLVKIDQKKDITNCWTIINPFECVNYHK